MKLGIMQPYFFPSIGYFALIKNVDHFILFDTPQHIRHGWVDRNRILNHKGDPIYIKIPLAKHSRNTAINDLAIRNDEKWKERILAQLVTYKKSAPYYWKVIILLNEIFEFNSSSLVEINYNSLKKVCDYLNISTSISIWSKMNIEIEQIKAPDEWALNICKVLNYTTYYNAIGGRSFFNPAKYEKAGIAIKFLEINHEKYEQNSIEFILNLSIIDVLMFNSPKKIYEMLNNYNLI